MMPRSPHNVTIGTGDCRISPTVVLIDVGQLAMEPSGVAAQSNPEIISASWPPPIRNACRGAIADRPAVMSCMLLFPGDHNARTPPEVPADRNPNWCACRPQ